MCRVWKPRRFELGGLSVARVHPKSAPSPCMRRETPTDVRVPACFAKRPNMRREPQTRKWFSRSPSGDCRRGVRRRKRGRPRGAVTEATTTEERITRVAREIECKAICAPSAARGIGNRISIMPDDAGNPARQASSPKSLSMMIFSSGTANANMSSSLLPGATVRISVSNC